MSIGSVVFGPSGSIYERDYWKKVAQGSCTAVAGRASDMHACNCLGPQTGETKCPCALRSESEQGRRMIQDGVVVNGKRYRLVLE